MHPGSRGLSSRGVLLGLLLLGFVVVGAFAFIYYRVVHYHRRAAQHVPSSASFAARIDLEQIALFAPVREHIVPVLLRADEPSEEAQRLARLEEATGINLGLDLRELVFVSTESGQMGIIAGGLFPERGVVSGISSFVQNDAPGSCQLQRERMTCARPALVLEQAGDGILIAANSETLLDEMREPSEGFERLGLLPEGPGSFGWRWSGRGLGRGTLLERWVLFEELEKLERIEGRIELASDVRLLLSGIPKSGQDISGWVPHLEQLRDLSLLGLRFVRGTDYAGERAVLERTVFGSTREWAITAEAVWREDEMDQAAASLAVFLEAWLQGR